MNHLPLRNLRRNFLASLMWSVIASGSWISSPTFGEDSWHFVVSGDSRNCGNVVMPSIAAGARTQDAKFYWHLGDWRAIYDFDEDFRTNKLSAIGQRWSRISTGILLVRKTSSSLAMPIRVIGSW